MYYLYRHIRLDKNEPFYIGIGECNYQPPRYYRAHQKLTRSDFWKRITTKTDYEVEILYESELFSEICEKEKEFIKLYGRKDLGTGSLCNLNDGGGRTNKGYKKTSETIRKHAATLRGKKQDEEWIRKAREGKYKPVACYDLHGNLVKKYISAKETRLDGYDPPTVTNCCKGNRSTHKNLIWKYVKNIN